MTDNVIYGRFKPRLIHPTRTPLEDLAYAMGNSFAADRREASADGCGALNRRETAASAEILTYEQEMQASVDRVFCRKGAGDPCEGTSKPGDVE